MKVLERDGDGPGVRYRNAPATAKYRNKHAARYIGNILEIFNARLYGFSDDLSKKLRTGSPQNDVKHNGKPLFEEEYSDERRQD